uniref:DUF761 domain-containing protein n=1 Tax=Cajanus cajan TaxID=3821 RepID=A0A151SXS5_CAJCA|nr:hypothetical protein KK1_015042 [Cajanus cajan]
MRKSQFQPSGHNKQAFSSEEQKKRKASSAGGGSDDGAKKAEATEKTKPIEDINASADAFIKNFRQQLLIQRLQSMENYEQMLARGL